MASKNEQRKHARSTKTKKAAESRQFSSVALPRKSEVCAPAQLATHMRSTTSVEDRIRHEHGEAVSTSSVFDPIPGDGMFIVVQNSQYWPPLVLASESGLGQMDMYDRLGDDERSKSQHVKKAKGEISHPRGKPRRNKRTALDDGSESDSYGRYK